VCLQPIKPDEHVSGVRDDLMHEACDYLRRGQRDSRRCAECGRALSVNEPHYRDRLEYLHRECREKRLHGKDQG
jgi:hypothetical protein